MDRLTTGRRHARAGSVTVTELITKQSARPEPAATASRTARTDRAAATPVHEGPTSHRRPPSRAAQVAKLTSLGLATAALCGAIGIASTIAHQRQDASAAAARPAEPISGEQALLPDELNRSLSRDGAPAAKAPNPEPETQAPRQVAPAPATSSTAPPATTTTVAAQPTTNLGLVRQFYDVLPSDPEVAFNLISPDLLHSTLGRFLESWSHVRQVEVLGLHEQANGVLATVRMRLADGGHLKLRQLLTVAEAPRRIVDVELLSAQRD